MSNTVSLRSVESEDRASVERLLAAAELPTADLSAKLDCLYVCEADGRRVGVAGLEDLGDVGLLRSLAVEPAERGRGYGTCITDRMLECAREADHDAVYLLTTTAADFFEGFGFEAVTRESVPAAVRSTTEFQDLCPSSATCMRRALDGGT